VIEVNLSPPSTTRERDSLVGDLRAVRRMRHRRFAIVRALKKVVEVGVPVRDENALYALSGLRELCGWTADQRNILPAFNKVLINELRRLEDKDLGDAAIVLFGGATRHIGRDLSERRRAAAELLDVDEADFAQEEERILDIIAWRLQGVFWPTENRNRPIPSTLFLPIFASACFVAALITFGNNYAYRTMWIWLVRAILAATAIACAFIYARARNIRSLQASSKSRQLGPDVDFLPKGTAYSLQRRAGLDIPLTRLEAEVFALAITSPSILRSRVVESYQPEQRTLRQKVTVDIQIPGRILSSIEQSEPSLDRRLRIPFPVVVLPKGELNDNLKVRGADDSLVPSFSYREYLALVAGVLRMLLLKAYSIEHNASAVTPLAAPPLDTSRLPLEAIKAERIALQAVMQRGAHRRRRVNRQKDIVLEGTIESAVDGILSLGGQSANGDSESHAPSMMVLKLAAELVRKLSNHYAVVADAECNSAGRMLLSYERMVVPELEIAAFRRGQRARWLKGWLELMLGSRPVDLLLELDNAPTCQSYHLVTACPEGLYLREQELEGIDEYFSGHGRRQTLVPPYYRVRQRLGQPHAHFYARFFPTPKVIDGVREPLPDLKLSFYETPPGSQFRASVVSLSSFILIWIVGYALSRSAKLDHDIGTDAPTILLAFPAIIAAWLGFDNPARRLLEGTLGARISLIGSALAAILASGLFVIYRANVPILHGTFHPFPIYITFLGIQETSWAWLAAFSLINTAIATYAWLVRTWEFKYLASRKRAKVQDVSRLPWEDLPVHHDTPTAIAGSDERGPIRPMKVD
jgi:hypothetical protein